MSFEPQITQINADFIENIIIKHNLRNLRFKNPQKQSNFTFCINSHNYSISS